MKVLQPQQAWPKSKCLMLDNWLLLILDKRDGLFVLALRLYPLTFVLLKIMISGNYMLAKAR